MPRTGRETNEVLEKASAVRPQVLVIDDNAVFRMLLEEICSEYGWTAVGVASCADALLAAGLQHVDLILLDLNLKEGTALSLIPELRSIRPGSPIVVVTGQSRDDVQVAVTAAGAHDVIGKPCSVAQIAELLGRYRPVHVS